PQPPVGPPPGFVPPPVGAYGAPQPPTEAPTAPVIASPPTVQLRTEPPNFDTPPPGPVVTDVPEPAKPEPKAKKGGVSWKALLVVALVMAIGGTAGGVFLMKKLGDSKSSSSSAAAVSGSQSAAPLPTQSAVTAPATGSSPTASNSPVTVPTGKPSTPGSTVSAPARPTGYTPALDKVSLSIPGADYASDAYKIDLTAGKVVPRGNDLKWGFGVGKAQCCGGKADSFAPYGNDASDFAVISESSVTPEQCASAIDSRPDTDLSFNRVTAGRLLCIRDRVTQNIAVAVVEVADASTGAAKATVSTWRANGQPGLS
ncbi:hypothetical protein AB0O00_30710, partial [Kitasatospora sp. NPDC093558]